MNFAEIGKSRKSNQTTDKFDKYYVELELPILTKKTWFSEFRCGSRSMSDAKQSGRSIDVTTLKTLHNLLLVDRRL